MFALACGFLFGWLYGFILVHLAANIGMWLGFWLARWSVKSRFGATLVKYANNNKVVFSILRVIAKHPVKIIVLIRLSPFPYNLVNGIIGITMEVPFLTYAFASYIGALFEQVILTYYGSLFRNLADVLNGEQEMGPLQYSLYGLQLLVVIILSVVITIYVKKEMQKLEQEANEEEDEEAWSRKKEQEDDEDKEEEDKDNNNCDQGNEDVELIQFQKAEQDHTLYER